MISLPKEHRSLWPGCGGNASAAALKIQVRWDVLRGGLDGLILEPGRRPDQSTELKPEALPAGSLWIADLGYFDVATLADLAARRVYFLSRIQRGTAGFDAQGQRLDPWKWLESVRGQTTFERAIGLGAQHRLGCRLVASRCPAHVVRKRIARLEREATRKGRVVSQQRRRACRWTVLVTNAPAERLSCREAYDLYRVRWQIENGCHWSLDVTFGEDECRLRKGHADANFSILRRTALSLLKNNHDLKVGIKNKRLAAGWDDSYLEQVLLRS